MIGFLLRTALKLLTLSACVYFAVFVKVGQYTLYEHACRIGKTAEARELGSSVATVVGSAREKLQARVGNPDHARSAH